MKIFTQLLEGRSFVYRGHKYSSGFGRYTKDGESITKEEYQKASEKYKGTSKDTKSPVKKSTTKKYTGTKNDKISQTSLIDSLNKKSKTYQRLQKYPFKPSKTLKSCEEFISNFSGFKCSLAGITKKEVYNGCAESLHKVLSKYPQLGDSGCIEYFCTTKGVNQLYVEKYKQPDEEVNKVIDSTVDKLISNGLFAKLGNPAAMSLFIIQQYSTSSTVKKFCDKNNITYNDTIDEKMNKLLIDELKKQLLNHLEKSTSNKKYIKFGSVKNIYALYNPGDTFKGVYFVPSNTQNSINSYQRNVDSGFHCKGTTYKSITTHELGYAMESMLDLNNNPELKELYLSYSFVDVMNNVSRYATNDIHEFVAECFSEYIDSDNPREISKRVGEFIDREYEKYMIKQYGDKNYDE